MGMYVTQAVLHSAVAAILANCAIIAWGVADPRHRQSMRVGVILIPIVAYPLYQLFDPARGSMWSRPGAVMDSGGWLLMKLWDRVPVILPVAGVLGLAVLVFLLQEFLPVLFHTAQSLLSKGEEEDAMDDDEVPERYDRAVIDALDGLPEPTPDVVVIDDEDLVVFSSTGRVPAVYVSTGLIDAFRTDELRGAIAHEIAHIRRTRKPLLTFLFVFRVLMFFNPVALFEFRRAVQDEEEICDIDAVSATGNPLALSSALSKFLDHDTLDEGLDGEAAGGAVSSVEGYSHDVHIRKRVRILSGGDMQREKGFGAALPVIVFIAATVALNYFIV